MGIGRTEEGHEDWIPKRSGMVLRLKVLLTMCPFNKGASSYDVFTGLLRTSIIHPDPLQNRVDPAATKVGGRPVRPRSKIPNDRELVQTLSLWASKWGHV